MTAAVVGEFEITNQPLEARLVGSFRDGAIEVDDAPLKIRVLSFFWDLGGLKGKFGGALDVSVTDAATNFVFLDSGGSLVVNTVGYPAGTHIRLGQVVAASGVIVGIFPERAFLSSAVSVDSGLISMTSGPALVVGNLIAVDGTTGDAVLADANIASGDWELAGISTEAVGGASPVLVALPGRRVPTLFGAAPPASSNGSLVFLSTTAGEATLVPSFSSGTVLQSVGVLQGADGITATPDVLFSPQIFAITP